MANYRQPTVWDNRLAALFNWVWQDCTTFEAYDAETAGLEGLLGAGQAVGVPTVMKVLENLSPNAHKSFYLLCAIQLRAQSSATRAREFHGIAFSTYLALCIDNFTASNDNQLRNFLTEFLDHKLLRTQHVEGVEHLLVNMPEDMLRVVLDAISERWPGPSYLLFLFYFLNETKHFL
jgi:origin recognition complex subunit 2